MKKFTRNILLMDFTLIVLGGYPLYMKLGVEGILGGLLALIMTTVNVLVGYHFIEKYFEADFQTFMKKVFGSMGLRLLVLAVFIFLILKFAPIDQIGFTITLFVSYICKSVQELILLQSKNLKKQD